MRTSNGMAQGQQQLLAALCSLYGKDVDLLSLAAPAATARAWLGQRDLPVTVLEGAYAWAARANTTVWYWSGAVLCNKLGWVSRFPFPVETPLPEGWIERYDVIVCYYVWPWHLLGLERAGRKVVVDTGDVMADRHERLGSRRWVSVTQQREGAVLRSESRCLAVSVDDAADFERMYGVRPQVLSFVPPEHEELVAIAGGDRPARVGYMGAPSYVNEEVLRGMADPAFLDTLREAGIELVIAGGICETADRSVLRDLEQGGARILGRVASTAEYYRQISATVNPVGPSTGVKIKSVETLVAGRSLITTRWGADAGLGAAFPDQVAYVEWPIDPRALGQVCVEVVRRARSGDQEAARAYVENATAALRAMLRP
ncbi:MAG: glycosyltransferase [Acidobacteriaceae bacterium]